MEREVRRILKETGIKSEEIRINRAENTRRKKDGRGFAEEIPRSTQCAEIFLHIVLYFLLNIILLVLRSILKDNNQQKSKTMMLYKYEKIDYEVASI